MERAADIATPRSITEIVRTRIEQGGERIWGVEDFRDLPFTAVAQALSRLNRQGKVRRWSKGLYYLAREGSFGEIRPTPRAVRSRAEKHKALFPAGMAAANLLGFSTQAGRRSELATSSGSVPRKLIGADAVVHTRRPEAWKALSEREAALLDFLRRGGRMSELSPDDTLRRTLKLLAADGTFAHLAKVAPHEPPRVRALLGALGEHMKADSATLTALKDSLNPLSKFDFGIFAGMANAKAWQAKGARR